MRHLLAVCVLAGSAAGLAAAPVPKGAAKRHDFFPLAVGHKWEYTGTAEQTVEVTEVADTEDKKYREYDLKHSRKGGRGDVTLVLRVTDEGVLFVHNRAADRNQLVKPATYLMLPLKAGEKWQRIFDHGKPGPATFDFEVGEAEAVTVHGTAYTATRVSCVGTGGGADTRKTVEWYAAGVGLVKEEVDGKPTLELKSFTPADGKAKK